MGAMFKNASSFTSTLDQWNVTSDTNMDSLFEGATDFTSNLADWCVEKISTEPENFATGSQIDESAFPDWGQSCQPCKKEAINSSSRSSL